MRRCISIYVQMQAYQVHLSSLRARNGLPPTVIDKHWPPDFLTGGHMSALLCRPSPGGREDIFARRYAVFKCPAGPKATGTRRGYLLRQIIISILFYINTPTLSWKTEHFLRVFFPRAHFPEALFPGSCSRTTSGPGFFSLTSALW